jgi:5-methylcytosine-specific restriction endonuclease McrA
MAVTKTGADKIAAKKIGISLDQYYRLQNSGMKWCTKGKHWQPVAHFNVDRSRGSGLSSNCRSCSRHGDVSKPSFEERHTKRELGLDWCCACLQWKPQVEIYGGYCRPCANAEDRRRYAEDPAYRARRQQHAYSRKRGIQPIAYETQQALTAKFSGRCAYCGNRANTWDHVMPVSKGGDSSFENVVPACASCNSSKKTQDVHKWIKRKGIRPLAEFYEHTGIIP